MAQSWSSQAPTIASWIFSKSPRSTPCFRSPQALTPPKPEPNLPSPALSFPYASAPLHWIMEPRYGHLRQNSHDAGDDQVGVFFLRPPLCFFVGVFCLFWFVVL